jgi:hypothetical protein
MLDFHGDANRTLYRENPLKNTEKSSKHKKNKNAETNRR